jgi:hypothetical protein
MAECAYCKAETELHQASVPVCPGCSLSRTKSIPPKLAPEIQAALVDRIVEATARVSAANGAFSAVLNRTLAASPILTEPGASTTYHANWIPSEKR